MKKIFVSVLFLVAIASFGGMTYHTRAADLTPAEKAALEASLAAMKAKLIELQAQAAEAQANERSSPAAAGAPLTLLSASDHASMQSALAALSGALSGLQSALVQNPGLAATNAAGISMALKGIGTTLALMSRTLGGQAAAPIGIAAQTAPSSPSAPSAPLAQTPPQAATPPLLSANGSAKINADKQPLAAGENISIVSGEDKQAQTAQAVSAWSLKNLNWPLIVVIALVIVAIGLWLFWPERGDEGKGPKRKGGSGAPAKSAPTAQPTILISRTDEHTPPPVGFGKVTGSTHSIHSTQTPLATAVSAPMQKPDATSVRIVPPQREQQRNPA